MACRGTSIYVLVPHTSWCCQQFVNSMMPKSPKCVFILSADFNIGLVTGVALKTGFLRRATSWPVCIFEMLNTILIECFAPYRPKLYVQHFIKIIF